MHTPMHTDSQLLFLLQLCSSSLPVGAYSYSEGLETLVDYGKIRCSSSLQQWLESELRYGAIGMEAAVMVRVYKAAETNDLETLKYWNQWLSAARETEELRNSSQQMGRALVRLLIELEPKMKEIFEQIGDNCNCGINYAIAFTVAATFFGINLQATLLGYLHSWLVNLVTAGIKLIPLGQTTGQILLKDLQGLLIKTVEQAMAVSDDDLGCCSWGLALASMQHETLYTRLFRS
ncbi:urease accessory protein UreF [Calothrix sp. PCC 6303]|uniref:urease accessory protein UreF n=1 Tax=Calothrix sp. PCC 6303 TaxID=1170562 RepID=UPI00059F4DF9|nr:urease accessory protein UreF [Calothrix sp. PCC 6303]